jgi:hypothetical protein
METLFGTSFKTALGPAAVSLMLLGVFAGGTALIMHGLPAIGGTTAESGPELVMNAPETSPYEPLAASGARCQVCGVIESVREIREKPGAENAPIQVAGTDGRFVRAMASTGATSPLTGDGERAPGARYEVTVRMKDGSSRIITGEDAPAWRRGKRVILIDGAGGAVEQSVRVEHSTTRSAAGVAQPAGSTSLAVSAVQLQRK